MAEYDNRNSGILWKNDRKQKDTHPDLSGYWTDGDNREYYLSAWRKKKPTGEVFFTLSARPKEEPQRQEQPQGSSDRPMSSYDDNDPFNY